MLKLVSNELAQIFIIQLLPYPPYPTNNHIIITIKTNKITKRPTKPIKNIGIRMISPNIAINNCNGIENHNTKK